MRLEFEPNVAAVADVHVNSVEPIQDIDTATLLKRGISAAQSGDRELARKLLNEVAQCEPSSADAWMWLASIAEYPEELLACLDHVLGIDPDNARALEWQAATRSLLANTFVQRGASALDAGEKAQALSFFDQAIEHDRDSEMAWYWKASLADDESDKVEYLRRVLSINVDNADAQSALADVLRGRGTKRLAGAKAAAAAGDNEEALALLDQVLELDRSNADAWMLRSHLATDIDDKMHALQNVIAIDPANAAARGSYDFLSSTLIVEEAEQAPVEAPSLEEFDEESPYVPVSLEDESQGDVEMMSYSEPQQSEIVTEEFKAEADPEGDQDSGPTGHEDLPVENDDHTAVAADPQMEVAASEKPDSPPLWETAEAYVPMESSTESVDMQSIPVAAEAVEIWEESDEEPDAADRHEVNVERATEPVAVTGPFDEKVEDAYTTFLSADFSDEAPVKGIEPGWDVADTAPSARCMFCDADNERQVFECQSCGGVLTLSDIDALVSASHADRTVIQRAVTEMEAGWNLREFDADELIELGIGHFNLGNFSQGVSYLQEASLLRPNDVILSGQINALVIRIDELRRQDEVKEGRPKGRTILVVDDSATVRKLIAGKLEKSGHNVVCAEDGIEGLTRMSEQPPDLVLLDITMPRMDGYEVCRQIRSTPATKDIPVVMISGKDGFFDKVRGRMAGTTAYITKPFGPETLMKALETYLIEEKDAVYFGEVDEEPVAA